MQSWSRIFKFWSEMRCGSLNLFPLITWVHVLFFFAHLVPWTSIGVRILDFCTVASTASPLICRLLNELTDPCPYIRHHPSEVLYYGMLCFSLLHSSFFQDNKFFVCRLIVYASFWRLLFMVRKEIKMVQNTLSDKIRMMLKVLQIIFFLLILFLYYLDPSRNIILHDLKVFP